MRRLSPQDLRLRLRQGSMIVSTGLGWRIRRLRWWRLHRSQTASESVEKCKRLHPRACVYPNDCSKDVCARGDSRDVKTSCSIVVWIAKTPELGSSCVFPHNDPNPRLLPATDTRLSALHHMVQHSNYGIACGRLRVLSAMKALAMKSEVEESESIA